MDLTCPKCSTRLQTATKNQIRVCPVCGEPFVETSLAVPPPAPGPLPPSLPSTLMPRTPHDKPTAQPILQEEMAPRKTGHRARVLALFAALFFLGLLRPSLAVLSGFLVLGLCVAAYSSLTALAGFASRVLRLQTGPGLLKNLRTAGYCLVGLILAFEGFFGLARNLSNAWTNQERQEAEHAQAELSATANLTVASLVDEASVAWKRGDSRTAEKRLSEASKVPHATSLEQVAALRNQIGRAEVQRLVRDAAAALNARRMEEATAKLTTALAMGPGVDCSAAQKLSDLTSRAQDAAYIRGAVEQENDDRLQKVVESKLQLPCCSTGYKLLDERSTAIASVEAKSVLAAREQRRAQERKLEAERQEQARLKAEAERVAEEKRRRAATQAAEEARQAAEEAQKAAEAAKKAEADRVFMEEMAREVEERGLQHQADSLAQVLRKTQVVRAVSARTVSGTVQATITVENVWHVQHKQIRLQAAENIWKQWALITGKGDDARIKIVDLNGNEVGGSRMWGGSLIWVQD